MTPTGSINSNQTNMPRVIGQMPGGQMPNGNMRDGMSDDMDYMGFMDTYNYFRMLWSQHHFWTMYVIEAIIFDLPTLDAATERLLRNPIDFVNALVPYYGEEAAAEFGDLFTEHVTIAGEVVQAAKAGDNNGYNNAQERWHENADQIAAFLGNLDPNWSEEDWNAMLYDHLDLLTTAVGDLLSEDYTQAISMYDDIELQILEMSDMMIEGILSEGME
jgi:lysyl-tRNA synthetase class I